MPLYTIMCETHGEQEVLRRRPESVEEAPCPKCGLASPRKWTAIADMAFRSYWSEGLSTGALPVHITSRKQEEALMKKLECARAPERRPRAAYR
jgi:hypothetical protein